MISFKGILEVVLNGSNWFFRRKEQQLQDAQLAEDVELADAIKKGDSETVSAIREKRRRYPNTTLWLLIVTGMLIIGCDSFRPRKTIPLATGTQAYQLPAGDYIDTKGVLHHEDTNRWSLCEADLFNKSRPEALKPKSNKEFWDNFIFYGSAILVGILIGIFIFKKSA